MLSSKNRIHKNREFNIVYKYGKRSKTPSAQIIFLPPTKEFLSTRNSEFTQPRFGFVISSKIGNSVVRHLYTRRLRHIFNNLLEKYSEKLDGYRVTYIAHSLPQTFTDLQKEITDQFKERFKDER